MSKQEFTISGLRTETLKPPFYFFSDTHISTRRGTVQEERLNDILDRFREIGKTGGTLFILGDFFDFWFDCRHYIPENLKPVVKALQSLREKGIEIHYIGGNHDYWIEGYLTAELGIRFYPDAFHFEYKGTRFYCQHGDHVIYNHPAYPLIRRILRAPWAIALLKCLPASWIYVLGERISHYNRSVPDIPRVSELLIGRMRDYLLEILDRGYDIALTGHVHAPLRLERNGKIIAILGDWIHHRSYAVWDGEGFYLIDNENNES